MPIKFRTAYSERVRMPQFFDKEKITVTICGDTYNQYERIQANDVDTNIYDVMKKYHILPELALEKMQARGGIKAFYGDISEIQERCHSLSDAILAVEDFKQKFENLPSEIREKYGNNLQNALEDYKKQTQVTEQQKNEPKQN